MTEKYIVRLTEEERAQLTELVNKGSWLTKARRRTRSNMPMCC